MKLFFKYSFVLLLFNTVLLNIDQSFFDFYYLFLIIMSLGLFFLITNPNPVKEVIYNRGFLYLGFINLVNLIYFLLFDINIESFYFLISRAVQFILIAFSIFYHYNYFKNKFLDHVVYFISIITLIGFMLPSSLSEIRFSGILWNENMLASLTGIAFSILLIKNKIFSKFQLILLFLLLLSSLLTGTRSVLIYIILAFIYKYGLSFKNFIYTLLGFLILISINHRVFSSENDRFSQWVEGVINISNNPYLGYGLSVYDGSLDTNIEYGGVHNGYLSFIMQYGIIFGSFIIFIVLRKSILTWIYFKDPPEYIRAYLFIVIITLITALVETLMTGINEFQTLLFWFSLSFLSFVKFSNIDYGENRDY
tara:strand:- start:27 stop:1121 length:1095 start_codon:yes stop_codon:yes gene_type:complete